MIGAIVGDVVGSRFEFDPVWTKNFKLFNNDCKFTDDTVMTLAVADWIMEGSLDKDILINNMHKLGTKYIDRGYGKRFLDWILNGDRKPYNSLGNGSAMRVSPCAYFAKSLSEARKLAVMSAEVTHNHPEGIKGAEATASAIYMAKEKKSKEEIKAYIEHEFGYDLSRTIKEISKDYHFDVTCEGSVPEAIIAFLESENFEDAIRIVISLGGDCDTQGAITGAIAEMYYGVPEDIKEKALSYLEPDLREIVDRMYK